MKGSFDRTRLSCFHCYFAQMATIKGIVERDSTLFTPEKMLKKRKYAEKMTPDVKPRKTGAAVDESTNTDSVRASSLSEDISAVVLSPIQKRNVIERVRMVEIVDLKGRRWNVNIVDEDQSLSSFIESNTKTNISSAIEIVDEDRYHQNLDAVLSFIADNVSSTIEGTTYYLRKKSLQSMNR